MNEPKICPGWTRRKSSDDKGVAESCAKSGRERPQILRYGETMCPRCTKRMKEHDNKTFAAAEKERNDTITRRREAIELTERFLSTIGGDASIATILDRLERYEEANLTFREYRRLDAQEQINVLRVFAGLEPIEWAKESYYTRRRQIPWKELEELKTRRDQAGTDAIGATPNPDIREEGASA